MQTLKNKNILSEFFVFLIICSLLWFLNKQHEHIIYLEDTVKIQDQAIQQQLFLIECQKIYIQQKGGTIFDKYKSF